MKFINPSEVYLRLATDGFMWPFYLQLHLVHFHPDYDAMQNVNCLIMSVGGSALNSQAFTSSRRRVVRSTLDIFVRFSSLHLLLRVGEQVYRSQPRTRQQTVNYPGKYSCLVVPAVVVGGRMRQ